MTQAAYHTILTAQSIRERVLNEYDIPGSLSCHFLKQGINDVYLLEADKKYIFRISRARRFIPFTQADYGFEMDLLRHCGAKGISVALPILNKAGASFGSWELPEGIRYYALFEYVEGQIQFPETADQASLVGASLAKLHNASRNFEGERFTLDLDFLLERPFQLLEQQKSLIAESHFKKLTALYQHLAEVLPPLLSSCKKGVIQGDFWWHNYHNTKNGISFFDFDFCGFGWEVYDLAAFIGTIRGLDYPFTEEQEYALISGYREVNPLNSKEIRAIAPLSFVRIIWGLGLWTTLIPMNGEQWFQQSCAQALSQLDRLLETKN